MSSSQSLTITESHGFRCLAGGIVAVFAAMRWLVGRIAEPDVRDRRQAVESACWPEILGHQLSAASAVCTHGTSALVRHIGRRDGPSTAVCASAVLPRSSPFVSPLLLVRPLAPAAVPADSPGGPWT